MSDQNFKIASINENTRLCVIENSIFIEELSSKILGNILSIDWRESKSFGNTSASLSFNQKLQLIQDIKGIDKEDLKKLNCIANIRNKFAHVSEIDSFEKLFSESSVGKEIRSLFLKRFFDEKGESDIHPSKLEFVYRLCYYLLVNDVVEMLLKINDAHTFNSGIQEGQNEYKEKLIELLINSLLSQNQQLTVLKAIGDAKGQFI
jgi:hypothetical protein